MKKVGEKQLSAVFEHNPITSFSISPASIPSGFSALATPSITRRRWLAKTPLSTLAFTSNLNLNFWKFCGAANLGRAGRWRKSEWGRQEQREVTESGTKAILSNSTSCWAIAKQKLFQTRKGCAKLRRIAGNGGGAAPPLQSKFRGGDIGETAPWEFHRFVT